MDNGAKNYRPLAKDKLKEMIDKYPDYTIGEIIYSALIHTGAEINTKKDIRNLSDYQIYAGLDRAISLEEKEENHGN